MKIKERKSMVDNGISVSYSALGNERVRYLLLNDIMLMLLTAISAVGAIMTFATILQLNIVAELVIPLTVLFSAVFGYIYKVVKKHSYLVIVATILLVGILFLIFKTPLLKGVAILYEQAKITISEYMFWDKITPQYKWEDSFYPLTNSVIILLSFFLCSLISYFLFVHPSFIAIVLLTFPFFEIGALFGAVPNRVYFSMMLASWTGTLTFTRAANQKQKIKKANGKRSKKQINGMRNKFATTAVAVALITIFIFSSITTIFNYVGFIRTKNLDALKKIYKSNISNAIDVLSGEDNDGSLKEGQLLKVDDRVIKDRHYFTLETTLQKIDEPLKLKGYTATTYNKNEWGQTENYDKYTKLFDDLSSYSYRLGGINGNLLSSHKDYDKFNASMMTLSDFRRKKDYAYEAYYADFDNMYYTNFDTSLTPEDNNNYTYKAYIGYEYLFKINASGIYKNKNYKRLMKEYTKFVNAEYTSSYATKKVSDLTKSLGANNSYALVDKVREYLKKNIKQTYVVDKSPTDKDFVEHFLFETKRGYSTHYATAAAVMLQSQGVPARYVEGYFIKEDDFNKTETDRKYGYITFDVTDRYAHAWIEVYDETFGWVPVEVTPGYWVGSFEELMNEQLYVVIEDNYVPEDTKQKEEEPDAPKTDPKLPDEIVFEPPEKTEEEKIDFKYIIYNVVTTILLLIFIVVLIIIAKVLLAFFVRTIKLHSRNKNKLLYNYYNLFLKLCDFEGIETNNIYKFSLFIKTASTTSKNIDEIDLEKFINIILKNTYSRESAGVCDINFVKNFVKDYRARVFKSSTPYKKLYFIIIKSL